MIKKMIQLFYSPEIARTAQIHPKKKATPPCSLLHCISLSHLLKTKFLHTHSLSLSLSLSKIQKQKHHSETEIIAPQKKKVFIFFSFLLFQKKLKNCDSV